MFKTARETGAGAPPLKPTTNPLSPVTPTSTPKANHPNLDYVDRIMTPPSGYFPETRRRGRQATACLECNRRKQKCDRLQPCHHCAKRNLISGCVYPDAKPASPETPTIVKRKSTDDEPYGLKRERLDDAHSDHSPTRSEARSARSAHSTHSAYSAHSDMSHSHNSRSRSDSSSSLSLSGSFHRQASLPGPESESPFIPSPSIPLHPPAAVTPSRAINRSIPVSSERHEVVSPPPRCSLERYDDPPRNGTLNFEDGRTPHVPPRSAWDGEAALMQEGGAPGIGSLAKEGGAETHGHQFQFYGTSHFGPRLAAQVMHGKTTVDVSASQYRASSGDAELLHQIHQLDGALPKRSQCKRFVSAFFNKYNSWVDILYGPDFEQQHEEFWVIHSAFEDWTKVDLRWFALFHTVLAFGSLLDDNGDSDLTERLAISDKCFLSARRALSEAPSFYGESLDTVAAYTLLSLYLVAMRRMPESWHMLGSGVRAAQAQGFQVDGETWHLAPKSAELWRRLWTQMYILDRSISYFLGRPLAIQDGSFTTRTPGNMHDSEINIVPRRDWPLAETTTKSTFLILHYKLAQIIGQILTTCFGLNPRNHADVMACENMMVNWQQSLPPVFRFDDPDTSLDAANPWIRLQRRTLMSKFHQARISLHRPYLLPSGREEYGESRMCCVISAGVELRHRLSLLETDHDPFDRFKWLTVASGFSPACVLGLLLARAKREQEFNYDAIRNLLVEYINVEKTTLRRDMTLENELRVLDMMLAQADEVDAAQAQRSLRTSKAPTRVPTPRPSRRVSVPHVEPPQPLHPHSQPQPHPHTHPQPQAHPLPHVLAPQRYVLPAQPTPNAIECILPYSSFVNRNGALDTLAPAPQYAGDPQWFTFPSPMDPSAEAFPPVHDTSAWSDLLESIGVSRLVDEE